MSHKILRPFIVKVSVLDYFPLYKYINTKSKVTLFISCKGCIQKL